MNTAAVVKLKNLTDESIKILGQELKPNYALNMFALEVTPKLHLLIQEKKLEVLEGELIPLPSEDERTSATVIANLMKRVEKLEDRVKKLEEEKKPVIKSLWKGKPIST